jgi:hypothetical protein
MIEKSDEVTKDCFAARGRVEAVAEAANRESVAAARSDVLACLHPHCLNGAGGII